MEKNLIEKQLSSKDEPLLIWRKTVCYDFCSQFGTIVVPEPVKEIGIFSVQDKRWSFVVVNKLINTVLSLKKKIHIKIQWSFLEFHFQYQIVTVRFKLKESGEKNHLYMDYL